MNNATIEVRLSDGPDLTTMPSPVEPHAPEVAANAAAADALRSALRGVA